MPKNNKRNNNNNNNNNDKPITVNTKKSNKKRRKRYARKSNNFNSEINEKDPNMAGNIIIRFPPLLVNSKDSMVDPFHLTKPPKVSDYISKYFDNTVEDDLVLIDTEINTIDDLIALGKKYESTEEKKYTIDLETLHNLVAPLENLKKMIGMKSVKETIVNLVLYNLQNFEKKNSSMLHTIIEGRARYW